MLKTSNSEAGTAPALKPLLSKRGYSKTSKASINPLGL